MHTMVNAKKGFWQLHKLHNSMRWRFLPLCWEYKVVLTTGVNFCHADVMSHGLIA